jgi:hypothetical protein
MRIPFLSLAGYPLPLLITGLALFLLHQVLVGDIEKGWNIFDGGGDWIERPAPGFDGCFEELDLISFKKFQDVAGHFGLHLMELAVLGGGVHLEGLPVAIAVLRLAGQGAGETARVRVHVVVLLHL